jgi:Fe-S cluster assembly protein SufD
MTLLDEATACPVHAEPVPTVDALRVDAFSAFLAAGFPDPNDEEWRFTDIRELARAKFVVAAETTDVRSLELVERYGMRQEALTELVFINGRYVPSLSTSGRLPPGVAIQSLGCMMPAHPADLVCQLGKCANLRRNRFVALNTCFFRDGVYLHIAKGAVVPTPIHALCISLGQGEPIINSPRLLVVAEDGATAVVVETHVGAGSGLAFNNAVTELTLGDGAAIDYCKVHHDAEEAYHIGTTQARLGRDARFTSHVLTLGGKLVRNDVHAVLTAPGGDATLNGLSVLSGRRTCDNHTLIDHAAPGCRSSELYKNVLAGRSIGVFKGRVVVREHAQRTVARQASRTLLLDDDATMHALPLLEILADDVSCAHGATAGPPDPDQVFYQRTRGISEATARDLLAYAFTADLTRRIPVAAVRRRIEQHLALQHGLPTECSAGASAEACP